MQLIASTLFQDAAPVASPIIERSFAEKVAEAVAVIKSLILAGKRLIVASSFGKDSSVTLAIALKAMEQLKAEGFEVPELHVLNSDTLLENPRVHSYSKDEIRALKAYAEKHGLPVRIWVCSPNLRKLAGLHHRWSHRRFIAREFCQMPAANQGIADGPNKAPDQGRYRTRNGKRLYKRYHRYADRYPPG